MGLFFKQGTYHELELVLRSSSHFANTSHEYSILDCSLLTIEWLLVIFIIGYLLGISVSWFFVFGLLRNVSCF